MDGGGTPAAAIAGSVWANATRSLTSFSLNGVASVHSTLANATSIDFRPPSGRLTELTFIGEALASVTWLPALYDGVTFRLGAGGASGAAFNIYMTGTVNFGPAFNNSGSVSGSYNVAGIQWNT